MACPRSYYIHHLDVYQGKNAANIGVKKETQGVQTTQKAMLNAVLCMGLDMETHGARLIAMDNR